MTRATLLRLLAHPTALNGADVRALEELAEAFPYCQTAHLLLAKAAHDHGSMLAGQRLRRAATYATDRVLLRQLIEAPPAEQALEPATAAAFAARPAGIPAAFAEPPRAAPAEANPAEPPYSQLLIDQPAQEIGPAPQAEAAAAPEFAATPPTGEPAATGATTSEPPAQLSVITADALAPDTPAALATNSEAVAEAATEAGAVPLAAAGAAEAEPATEAAGPAATGHEARAGTDDEAEAPPQAAEPAAEAAAGNDAETAPPETATTLPEARATAKAAASPAEPTPTSDAAEAGAPAEPGLPAQADPAPTAPSPSAASDPDELPVQAPPIRLPAGAEAASQEFGLAAAEPAEVTAYQLPELELDITVPLAPAVATPRLPAFSGVPDVAYAPGEGSRYGFCLVAVAEGGELLVPAASLPPAGEFFLPDALLLAHLAAPPELPTSTTTDLINSFLRRATGGGRRRAAPVPSGSQSDLSVRSTRAAPDLTSESLAGILARQGKVEQAIAVYERLMVKIPEKSAIFAAEIEALRPSA